MEQVKKYFWQITTVVLLILLLLLPKYCTKYETKVEYIKIPSKKGSFSSFEPVSLDLPNYIYINGKDTIELENPINKDLENKYLTAKKNNDSLQMELLYYKAIQTRKYHEKYEDNNITIDVYANTTGTLDSLGVKYKTKEDSIKVKQPVFRLLAGPQLQINNGEIFPAASIGIQNKKGNIFEGSINTNKDIMFGYKHNIWTIKK
jgi:hypothetical protein